MPIEEQEPYIYTLQYRVHVQTYGWQDWVGDGQVSGTTGEGKRLEAIQIRLVGDESTNYVLDFKTHIQTLGGDLYRTKN